MRSIDRNLLLIFSFLITASLSGCQVVGDIFEAGVWTGIIVVVLIVALLIWLVKKLVS